MLLLDEFSNPDHSFIPHLHKINPAWQRAYIDGHGWSGDELLQYQLPADVADIQGTGNGC